MSRVYQRVSEKKRRKKHDSLHKASHLIAHTLVERTVVVGDLSQRQMVMKQHRERNKSLNRAVYNEWGVYAFVQMLRYKCALYGKDLQYPGPVPCATGATHSLGGVRCIAGRLS